MFEKKIANIVLAIYIDFFSLNLQTKNFSEAKNNLVKNK